MTKSSKKLSPFGKPEERFKYWLEKYRYDIGAKCYSDWVKQVKISRHFRQNELEDAMKKLEAGGIYDKSEYWYADCGANRLEDFHLGRMLMSNILIKVKEDTAVGAEESESAQVVADILNDRVNTNDFVTESGRFGGDLIMDGTGVLIHRAEASIDPQTGATRVCMDYADSLEFVLDSNAKTLNKTKHRFRKRRMDREDIELEFDTKIKSDELNQYYDIDNKADDTDKSTTPADKRSDLLEVEFMRRRKTRVYLFEPEAATQLGIDNIITKDEYEEISKTLFLEVAPEDWINLQPLLESAEPMTIIVKDYYYDGFSNGKSLLPDGPKPLLWDEIQTPDGWSTTIEHFKDVSGTPYGQGTILFQRDKLIIRLMIMTLLTRAISRYKINRSYINANLVSDARDQDRIRKNEDGPIFVDGDPHNIEWYPRMNDVDLMLLQFVQYVDQNIRDETGVTLEQTGTTPFAGAPAAAIGMLQQSGSIQLTMRLDKYFRKMEEAIRKHYVLIRAYKGLVEIPDISLEIKFDDQSQQDKDNEGMKAMNLFQAGLLPGAVVLEKNGYKEGEALIQRKQLEDFGQIMQEVIKTAPPEIAQTISQLAQQFTESQSRSTGAE